MALDDLLISTGVDQLIRLVKERGKVEIGAAAKELKQPLRTIEDWAHVLEEEGLVRIEYKLTKIYLVWQSPSGEYVAQKTGKLEAKATRTKAEVEQLLSKVERGGAELGQMQQEVSRLEGARPISPQEAERLKTDLAELDKNYSSTIKSSSEKLERLRKKVATLAPQLGEGAKDDSADVEKELSVLRNFEKTLQTQLEDTEEFFGAFEARLEDFRKRIEEGKSDEKAEEARRELAEARGLKAELASAMGAMADEHKALSGKLNGIEEKLRELSERDDSLAGAKKKLAEIRRIALDARKQRKATAEQLSDALSLVKKQSSRLQEMLQSQSSAGKAVRELKDEYVDIQDEVSRASELLLAKQKEVSGRVSSQIKALDAGGKGANIDKEEVQKVSFMLRELRREQALLEENVRMLLKETDLLRLETSPAGKEGAAVASAAGGAQGAGEREVSVAFVEKVKLTEEEEGEFEHKREELRSLIRKMWEESRGEPRPPDRPA